MRFRLATSGANGGGQQLAGGVGNLFRSLAMAPAMAAQAQEEARMNQGKMDLQNAQTALFRNKSAEIDDARERGSLGSLLKTAQMVNGVPMSQQDEFGGFLQTGQMPGRYEPPVDGVGPRMPVPEFYKDDTAQRILQTLGLTNTALTVGDSNSLNIAKGAGEYQDQRVTDQAVALAGRGDDMGMSRLNSIRGKKEFTPFAAVGTTGTALNQITGAQDVSNAGLRALFGDKTAAEILADKERAGASRASAASSYASARKTNQDRELGAKGVLQQTDQGLMLVDPRTGKAIAVAGPDGKPIGGTAGKAPPGYRFTDAGDLQAIPGGPADIKAGELGAKRNLQKQASLEQADRVINKVDQVLSNVGKSTAGLGGRVLNMVPGTDATDLASDLNTIKANLGFAELQAMRDASPTGGALGAIAVQELIALQSTVASLDQSQSPAQLSRNLNEVRRRYANWRDVMKQASEQESGLSGGASGGWDSPGAPAAGGWSIQRVN